MNEEIRNELKGLKTQLLELQDSMNLIFEKNKSFILNAPEFDFFDPFFGEYLENSRLSLRDACDYLVLALER